MTLYVIALVCAVLSLIVPGGTTCYEHLRVKFSMRDGYYDIPKTVNAILKKNYVKMAHDEDLNVDLYALPDDPRVSIMFDTYGNIAGLRTSFIKTDVVKQAKANSMKFDYTYHDKQIYKSANYFGVDVWYTSVLFVSPEKLLDGGRDANNGQVAEDIYLSLEGKWTKIPKDECKAESLGFTKQSCFIGMGMHYFYKVTPDMDCNDFQGRFLLYESGELVGLGFDPFGSFTSGKDREWFEQVSPSAVQRFVPNGPKCLAKWAENYGVTSFHIFFKKFPRLTFCTWPWQKNILCSK